ncbi:hypothetical protein Hanom_Chr09g00809271 [Helianthus anomalus]
MISSHGSSGFSGKFIKLASGYTFVDTGTDLLGDKDRIAVFDAESVTQFLQSSSDFVEMHSFLTPISLHHIHGFVCEFGGNLLVN